MAGDASKEPLGSADVPSADADFAEAIFPFANSFDAYSVWSGLETVRGIAEPAWAAHSASGQLPGSLLKLRTSLFAAARYMRMTDFDEDIAGVPGSEAEWIEMMRDHVAAIGEVVRKGPSRHLQIAQATVLAAAQIASDDAAREPDLRVALARGLTETIRMDAGSTAVEQEHRFSHVPFWADDDPPGSVDLIATEGALPSFACELKLSDHNNVAHSLWDVVKLLAVLGLGAEHAYLIAGFPSHIWERSKFSALYDHGLVRITELPVKDEWPWLLAHSKGTPSRVANMIEITDVVRVNLTRNGDPWEIRAVAVEPSIGGWLTLQEGQLEGAGPYEADQG